MEDGKECFPLKQEKQEGVLAALLAGFIAGVTATIAMIKLVAK